MISNIREAPIKIELDTNAGSGIVDQVVDVEGVGTVYFNQNGIANICALKDLIKPHGVKYDSNIEDAFIVDDNGKQAKFAANDQSLYTFKFKQSYIKYMKRENNQIAGV